MKNVQYLSLKTQIHATTASYEIVKRELEKKIAKAKADVCMQIAQRNREIQAQRR